MGSISPNVGIIISIFLFSISNVTSNELNSNDNFDNEVFASESYRLPHIIEPETYEINFHINLDPENNFTFDGTVNIKGIVFEDTNYVILHRGKINFINSVITDGTNPLKITNESYDEKSEKHSFYLSSTIKKDSAINIKITYNGSMADNMKGLYKSSYFNEKNNLTWLAATQFQTIHARQAFPCFDEPSYKANFTIRISRPKSLSSLSNMPLYKTISSNGSVNEWDIYQSSVPMSTYLVALVVSDFASSEEKNVDGIKFKVWANKNFINQTTFALNIGPKALKYLSDLFKQNYQLPKMDMVAIPDFSPGAMENWGLITYKEAKLLYDDMESSDEAKQTIANIIVHELTHMWFGNLATPGWWGYLFLAEGFASYFQYFATNEIQPGWQLDKQFVVDRMQGIFFEDSLDSSKSLTRPVNSREDISTAGDSIIYSKGASIIRMMNLTFGAKAFLSGLQTYLEDKKYQSAIPTDLWSSIQKGVTNASVELNATVENIMNSWTTKPGYPVISVTQNKDKTFSISQERFFIRNPDKKSTKYTWWVPLTWTTKNERNFNSTAPKRWVSAATDKISIDINDDEWILFNVQQAGFYRVNYDKDLWYRIIDTLNSENYEEIDELNRAAILDDLLNLARAEMIEYKEALNGLKYIIKETNYLPIKSALNGLEYLHKRFNGREHYGIYANFMLKLITPIFEQLGFEDRMGDDHLTILLRGLINKWACKLGHEKCIEKSFESFSTWQNSSKSVPKNQKSTVYCTVAKHGTEEQWNALWNHFLNTNTASEKPDILTALACTQNKTILEEYLYSAISDFSSYYIRKQDSLNIFTAVAENSLSGAEYILEFVENNYNKMASYFDSENVISDLLSTVSQTFSTQQHYEMFAKFVNTNNKLLDSIKESLNGYLGLMKFELDWYDGNYGLIIEWIESKNNDDLGYRLPKSISPLTYDIYLIPDFDNFTFEGEVQMNMKVNEITSLIVMHANKLTIKEIVAYCNLTAIKVSKHEINSTTNKLTIYLDSFLKKGSTVQFNIKYSGIINDNMEGFYRSYYYDDAGKIHWFGTTQFEKFGARQAFPCLDEPAFKAKFTVNIQRPISYNSISNMPLLTSVTDPNNKNRTWDTFEQSVVMSTYLVAFVISDFQYIYKSSTEDSFKVWARPNAYHDGEIALEVGQAALKVLEMYTGILYPIDKMDFVAVCDFSAGAMENYGIVTFREYGLLANEYRTSGYYMRSMFTVIAHELTHMWFGNLVTCDWWDVLWLNEGFAEFFEWLVIAVLKPEWDMMGQFIVYDFQPALLADSFPYMRPMNNKMKNPYDNGRDNTKIVYGKSASVIHMMMNAFGDDAFNEGLQIYLRENQYRTAKPQILWSALQIAVDKRNESLGNTNETVSSLMDSWTNQPGYPLVKASLLAGTLTLLQERFLLSGKNDSHNELYWIPINFATETNPNFDDTSPTFWFGEAGVELKNTGIQNNEWYLINKKQSGFYRVNYDEKNWNNIILALNFDNHSGIIEINRAQIIDDLFNLARGGYISYELCFKGTWYLHNETNHLPWRAFFNSIGFLYERFDDYGSTEIVKLLGNYTIQLTKNMYSLFHLNERERNHTLLNQMQKETLLTWICKFDYPKCVDDARVNFADFKENEMHKISPDAKPAIFCTAMRYGDYDDWEFLWQQYHSSNMESEKLVILRALGCTRNTTALNKYFENILSNVKYIRDQNIGTAFSSIYSADSFGLNFTLEFLMNNYTDVYNFYKSWSSVGGLFVNVIRKFTTTAQCDKVELFLKEKSSELKDIAETVENALNEAKQNIAWNNANSGAIEKWLRNPTPPENDQPDDHGDFANNVNPCVQLILGATGFIIYMYSLK